MYVGLFVTASTVLSVIFDHFGWLGRFLGADGAASSALTRQLLGWQPTHPGLIDDLNEGHYFHERAA